MTAVLDKPEVEIKMISVKTIAQMLSLNESHVRDRVTRREDFPKPYKIGGAKRWNVAEVMEWLESKQ